MEGNEEMFGGKHTEKVRLRREENRLAWQNV